jgi:Ser/Thr protein kinase RdoA (MazF antagonist)
VVDAVSQPGGYSPGLASRLRLDDGRRIFVKAVGPELNPDSPGMFRREARIAAALPPQAPTPRLLWTLDEGEDGWVALAFEDVDGHPPANPWKATELDRVVAALVELSADLTPAPIEAPAAAEHFVESINGWQLLRADDVPPELDAWSRRHLERLAELEVAAPAATTGDTLLHFDTRSDNLLLTDDRVVVVDWPHACIGAPWIDLLAMAPSVVLEGGPDPEDLFMRHPAARAADPADVNAVLCSVAGYFTHRSFQPPPPGIPTVRAFQAAQGEVTRAWLAHRLGWR